jgi:hypothetical protein
MAEPSCLPCTPTWPAPWHTGKLTLKELDPAIHQEREQILPDKLLLSVADTAVIPATWNMQTNNN